MYTKEYIKQLQQLHGDKSRPRGFGGKVKDLGQIYHYLDKWNPASLLDYGCGKGAILQHLSEKYTSMHCEGYDPAVREFNYVSRQKYECVFSNDVLEHIEPQMLQAVLEHINACAEKYIWLRIDTRPARKSLPDGRNAHLILETPDWWQTKINEFIEGKIVYFVLNKKGKLDIAIEK